VATIDALSSSSQCVLPVEPEPVATPSTAPQKAQSNQVSSFANQLSVDTGYVLDNPHAAPTAQGDLKEQVKQAGAMSVWTAMAASQAAGENQDAAAKGLLMVLKATPPDTKAPTEYTNYTSTLTGVSPQAAFDYFVKNPKAWFEASGITLHPPIGELRDGARVFLAEPGVTPPVFAPIEVNVDEASRTVRITTLDGHPLRGVNQFSFDENANGDCELRQSSAFQLSSFAAEQGSTVMAKGEALGVPGAMDPIKRQHHIWEAAHANIADQAPRR
jgi:hypothetical protein